jgi:hypothetical protein
MAETPKYLIRHSTYIEGIGCIAREGPEEFDISPAISPRNSWEPLNDAARAAFKARDEKMLSESKARVEDLQKEIEAQRADGASEEELVHVIDELAQARAAHVRLPRALKRIPSFGPKPVYTRSEPSPVDRVPRIANTDADIEAARAAGKSAEEIAAIRGEKLVNAARNGGASEADIKALKQALESQNAGAAALVLAKVDAAKKVEPPKPEPKKVPRASDAQS